MVEVLLPTSPDEAAQAYGDGDGVTVLGGGTIVMPEITYGRLRPGRVLMLGRSGLDGVSRAGGVVTIGAAVTVAALEGADEPLATAARHVADPEIRGQATVGGNLCSAASDEAPRGDLQAPLIALGARVRSVGAGGERTEPVEDFLASPAGRLVLDVSYDDVARTSGYAAARRPHAHHYTILAAAAVRADDAVRVAVTGAGPTGLRCPSVEQALASGASGADAAAKVLDDVEPGDDALASAWYRSRVLPSLVARALADLLS
jgi:carbon-monoxide dehydrogenase medium subunit